MSLISADVTHMPRETKGAHWTYSEYLRIMSLDDLYHRSNDLHNTQYLHRSTVFDNTQEEQIQLPTTYDEHIVIVERVDFNKKGQSSFPMKYTAANINSLSQFVLTSNITWFHIHDIRILRFITNKCKVRDSFVAGFYDLRCRSNMMIFSDDCAFISYCNISLVENSAHLIKTYLTVTPSVYISFERELVPKKNNNVLSLHGVSLINRLMDSTHGNNLKKFVCEYGPLFFICQVGMVLLNASNPTIEFLSQCVLCVKVQIHKNLSYSEKLYYYKVILIVQSIILLLDRVVQQSLDDYYIILSKTRPEVNKTLHVPSSCVPFIDSTVDSCKFILTCQQRLRYDTYTVLSTMKNIQTVHNDKQAVNLSLIATILLPMTFLTGVFGMNFEIDGDYTINLLNDPLGPIYFAAMCVGVVLINLYLFTKSGYINWRSDVFGDNRIWAN